MHVEIQSSMEIPLFFFPSRDRSYILSGKAMNGVLPTPRRILIVDDDAAVRKVLQTILESAGHKVESATNGREAVGRIALGGIDLMITDLVMPEQEGIETIKQLRREYPDVKVIAISGAFGGDYLQIANFMGAHGTLVKPVRMEAVLNAVESVFQTAQDEEPIG
jgi:DNA-binding NtrC family response regulator